MTTQTSIFSHKTAISKRGLMSLTAFKDNFNTSRSFRTALAFVVALIVVAAMYLPAILSGQF